MNIVFLYSEVVGYTEGTLQALVRVNGNINLNVVYWDKKKLSAYKLIKNQRIDFHPRSGFTVKSLLHFLIEKEPEILFISGWMDRGYLMAAYRYKKRFRNVKIVAGIDDQWHGTIRQKLGRVIYQATLKSLFDYLWVAGKPQYFYARKLGYGNQKIIQNLYSANTFHFKYRADFSKRLVYLGRFSPEKGILKLVETYEQLPTKIKEEWPLHLIGDGPLKSEILEKKSEFITLVPFLQADELVSELSKGGIYCAPSFRDQWGVVIHEMAIMGYPMILSSVCGAATEFLISGYNGYLFDPHDTKSILDAMTKITSLSHSKLKLFAERSAILGQRINTEMTAHSLLSIAD